MTLPWWRVPTRVKIAVCHATKGDGGGAMGNVPNIGRPNLPGQIPVDDSPVLDTGDVSWPLTTRKGKARGQTFLS